MYNILIVENQYYQFNYIKDSLESDLLKTFPRGIADDTYDDFTELIRVCVCGRYKNSSNKPEKCFHKIISYIIVNKIKLIIMDVKLAGNDDGKTGIELATELLNSVDIHCPVLFLSHTSRDAKEIRRQLNVFETAGGKYDWLTKGIAVDGLFEPYYFRGEGKQMLFDLLRSGEKDDAEECAAIASQLVENFDTFFSDSHKTRLIEISEPGKSNEACRSFIKELQQFLSKPTNQRTSQIEIFFNDHDR